MSGISLVTIQRNLDESWKWTVFDTHGRRVLEQDKCSDLPHAMECVISELLTPSASANGAKPAQPARRAAKSPSPRKPRKQAASRGQR